jgi:type II secretion system protein G
MNKKRKTDIKGFTLIELLIVVAIIAILAAIAIPNFLAAQIRAKVSREEAEEATLATALESYAVDNNSYPLGYTDDQGAEIASGNWDPLDQVTTPVAYITSVPTDPLFLKSSPGYAVWFTGGYGEAPYWYWNIPPDDPNFGLLAGTVRNSAWRLSGAGPDGEHGQGLDGEPYELNWIYYDPSNGTVSVGEVMRWGP